MELNPDDERMTPREVLARHLRRLREGAGLSLRGLGEELRYQHTYFGRIENGGQLPSEALAKAIDDYFGTGGLFADLLKADRDAKIPDYGKVLRKEKEAVRIHSFNSTVIPGLLQIEEYARELTRNGQAWDTEEQIERWVADRMRRKRLFEREVPPQYLVVVDEAVLARPVGGSRIMCKQLEHVLAAVESVYNTVQVVPFAEGDHGMAGGTVTLLTLADGTMIGHVEGPMTGEPVMAPDRVIKLSRKFDRVRSKALSEERSRLLILRYLKEYGHAY
ncbi:helix-turn-helix transcriptional regulator [Streptomyces sp. B6B3]|uniref:helix-turn-helix domain-containing protein n=1 Tax=Streptomyces sp. B6B3 TaxID=3153570 RepID=UPI00325C6BBA